VAGALRLYCSVVTQTSDDTPWVGFNLWTWESLEINLGIVCASVPCLKALVVRFFPRFVSTRNRTITPVAPQFSDRRMGGSKEGPIADREAGYILESLERNGGGGGKAGRPSGESQEGLTKFQRIVIAKIGRNQLA
jgi:hypothetical protein